MSVASRAKGLIAGGRPLHPWDAGFDHSRQPVPDGLQAGPPDFVGIGAQKAGTTWWLDLIAQHPGVYHHADYNKERHFLARRGVTGGVALEELAADYATWFPRPVGKMSGEWTPSYLYYYWVADLLARAAPRTKVIVLLRDPIERYRSGLAHGESLAGSPAPASAQHAFARGLYGSQLRHWRKHFDDEHLLVLQYERCVVDPVGQLANTYRFLGLDDSFSAHAQGAGRRSVNKPILTPDRTDLLRRLYEDDVSDLVAHHPEVSLALWPHFADLVTGRGERG